MPRLTTYTITGPRTAQPVTIRQVNALLAQASTAAGIPLYEIVEGNDYLTRTLTLHQHAPVFTPAADEADQPVQAPSESYHPDCHELAPLERQREAATITYAEGEE